jgi:hypothetical protein
MDSLCAVFLLFIVIGKIQPVTCHEGAEGAINVSLNFLF